MCRYEHMDTYSMYLRVQVTEYLRVLRFVMTTFVVSGLHIGHGVAIRGPRIASGPALGSGCLWHRRFSDFHKLVLCALVTYFGNRPYVMLCNMCNLICMGNTICRAIMILFF